MRVTAADALHIPEVGFVHADEQVEFPVVAFGELPRSVAAAGDPMLRQLAPRRRVDGIAELLAAGCSGLYMKLGRQPRFSTKSFVTNSAIGLRQILPWQIKSTRMIIFSINFRRIFQHFTPFCISSPNPIIHTFTPEYGKMRQISASKRSQNVVEIAKTDYCGFGDEG